MREILFRAKGDEKYNNGGWYFGGGIGRDFEGDYYIQDNSLKWTIIPDTFCQYTGLKDKNDTKIFESDIVKATVFSKYGVLDITGVIEYGSGAFWIKISETEQYPLFECGGSVNIEVIGNVFDNPELIGGVEE